MKLDPLYLRGKKEWIENWMKLLEQAVEFQPTLYRLISLLSTRKELEQMQVLQAKSERLPLWGQWKQALNRHSHVRSK